MEDLLVKLDDDKKRKIINSAMKEFSKNSFQKASTNVIVEEARISKGLLYHYFGTKKKLYDYLEYFALKVMAKNIREKMDWNQEDIFLRIKEVSLIKFELLKDYPYLADFSLKLFEDQSVEEIMRKNPDFPLELQNQIYTHKIDFSLFKEGVDVEKAINIIQWTIEKSGEEYRRQIKNGSMEFDYKKIEKEIFVYVDLLKDCFYKEGSGLHD